MFADVLEQVKENLTPERGEAYCTAIVALGHIAFHLPEKFPVHIKNIVSRKIVKELIMKDQSEVNPYYVCKKGKVAWKGLTLYDKTC